MIIELDHQIIPELPYTWRNALIQGTTGVIATPSEGQLENIIQLAQRLIPIVKSVDSFTINSWYRTTQHNKDIGGATFSQHLVGNAVDLHPVSKTVEECKSLIEQLQNRVLFFEINTTSWLHLDQGHDHDFIA